MGNGKWEMGNGKWEMGNGHVRSVVFPIPRFLEVHPRSSAFIGGSKKQ
jgi:hypothetical protein